MTAEIAPVHPGEILLEEFIKPLGLTIERLSLQCDLPPDALSEIVDGRAGITPQIAEALARRFDTSEAFWLNLQAAYELERT